jgi:hypothetical protein
MMNACVVIVVRNWNVLFQEILVKAHTQDVLSAVGFTEHMLSSVIEC